jgi:glucosamine--fructose-6-phosphate aminotransferase (isomerizing)
MSLVLPLLGPGSLVIAFSQSGETLDVLEAVKAARVRGATVAAVVNAEGSSLHRFADATVLLGCGPERCVLATKSYTAQVAFMHMTAWSLAGDTQKGAVILRAAGERVQEILQRELMDPAIMRTARHIADHQHLFVLGRDRSYPLALEAALKIKEVSYLHAEGFPSGELKHGVIALVTHGTPCIILAPNDEFRRDALSAAAEVHARGAFTIGLADASRDDFDVTLPVAGCETSAYEIAVITQVLAYHLAVLRGCDPDKPRNLAKSVTVK